MKKLIFAMMLVLTAGLFTSCQKGENFFNGTWTGTSNFKTEYYNGTQNFTLTLDKKSSSSTLVWSIRYSDGDYESGTDFSTYRLVNDNMIIVNESYNWDAMTLNKQGNDLFWIEGQMTLTKSK